jgi:antitoxin (DNA-binding transcriptional repressor) of toxin-antitoxin stability system
MTVSEARAALPEVLDRVADGEEITITRHGQPVAVVVRPDILWSRRSRAVLDDAERIRTLLAEAAAAELPTGTELATGTELPTGAELPAGPGLTVERAEELIAEIRAGRDAR